MEELEGRVTALEGQMRSVRQDAAAARVLAGGADRDVAALTTRMDANTRLLEALRETQVEDHQAIIELQRRCGGVEGRLDGVEGRLGGVEGRLSGVEGRLESVDGRLESVDGRLAGLEGGQALILELLRRRNGHGEDSPGSAG
jgi:hypothetical protein